MDIQVHIFVWAYVISFTRVSRDSLVVKDARFWSHPVWVQGPVLPHNTVWFWVNGLAYVTLSSLTCKLVVIIILSHGILWELNDLICIMYIKVLRILPLTQVLCFLSQNNFARLLPFLLYKWRNWELPKVLWVLGWCILDLNVGFALQGYLLWLNISEAWVWDPALQQLADSHSSMICTTLTHSLSKSSPCPEHRSATEHSREIVQSWAGQES